MDRAADLDVRIRSRGLPQSVATIAVDGGAAVHPALDDRAGAVSPSADGPAWTVIDASGREDEATDDQLTEVARLLLPAAEATKALDLYER